MILALGKWTLEQGENDALIFFYDDDIVRAYLMSLWTLDNWSYISELYR